MIHTKYTELTINRTNKIKHKKVIQETNKCENVDGS